MRNLNNDFKNVDYKKLLDYGFTKKENSYYYEKNISNNQFKVVVELTKEKPTSKVIDLASKEEYILVDVTNSTGEFVGKIREEYESILNDITSKCTDKNKLKNNQVESVIKYIKENYNDDLEYLWEKFPEYAVWRNKKNNKWYGVLLVIPENKLGLDSDKKIEVIDLRYQKEDIKNIIDNNKVFQGYHMNKNSWITIKLDGSVDLKEIYKLVENSYELSLRK